MCVLLKVLDFLLAHCCPESDGLSIVTNVCVCVCVCVCVHCMYDCYHLRLWGLTDHLPGKTNYIARPDRWYYHHTCPLSHMRQKPVRTEALCRVCLLFKSVLSLQVGVP